MDDHSPPESFCTLWVSGGANTVITHSVVVKTGRVYMAVLTYQNKGKFSNHLEVFGLRAGVL